MRTATGIFSGRRCLTALALAVLLAGHPALGARPVRSDEDLLAVALLKTQLQKERVAAEREAAEKELQANSRTITEAEERMAIARETFDKQAALDPGIELRKARAARRDIKNTLARLESARASAESTLAAVRAVLISRESREPDRPILGIVFPPAQDVVLVRSDGKKAALKKDKPGFIESGDSLSARGAGGAGMIFLDGRGALQWEGECELRIEAAGPQEQALRLVRGKVQVAVESLKDLRGQLQDRAQGPEDDLSLALKRYQDLDEPAFARLFGKDLRLEVPQAVCAIRGTRLTVEVKADGTTDIQVLEGSVEVSDPGGRQRVVVEEGFKVTVTKQGISAPQKDGLALFDLDQVPDRVRHLDQGHLGPGGHGPREAR
jgi:hypothetical protein